PENFSGLQNWCQTIYELANVFAVDRHENSLCIRILPRFCAASCSSEGTTLHLSRACASKPSRYGCVLNTRARDVFRQRGCNRNTVVYYGTRCHGLFSVPSQGRNLWRIVSARRSWARRPRYVERRAPGRLSLCIH